MIDLCLQRNITFVSPDMLALKMNYSVQEIDKIYASLSSRGYVVNKTEGGKLVTSLDGINYQIIRRLNLYDYSDNYEIYPQAYY